MADYNERIVKLCEHYTYNRESKKILLNKGDTLNFDEIQKTKRDILVYSRKYNIQLFDVYKAINLSIIY